MLCRMNTTPCDGKFSPTYVTTKVPCADGEDVAA